MIESDNFAPFGHKKYRFGKSKTADLLNFKCQIFKSYAKLCGEFNTLHPGAKKGETGLISKGKYRYMAVSDGKGGIIVYGKWKQR